MGLQVQSAKNDSDERTHQRSHQDKPHCRDCNADGEPLLVTNLVAIAIEIKPLNVFRFLHPKHARQPAGCSHRFAPESRSDVIRPESLLLPSRSTASQLCEHVSRNAEILNHAGRRRNRQIAVDEGRGDSEFSFQHAGLPVICERLKRTAFLGRHALRRKAFFNEVLTIQTYSSQVKQKK